MDLLALAGRQAKWVLALGLVVAVAVPPLAQALAGWLVFLIIGVMFLGALRIRPEDVAVIWTAPGRSLLQILAIQAAPPILAIGVVSLLGLGEAIWAQVLVLLLSASAIMSSPNMAAILKIGPASAMRLTIWGTVLVPVTCLPALFFLFGSDSVGAVMLSAGRLALIIALAGGAGVLVRRLVLRDLGEVGTVRLDGVSAIALAVFVIALMPALSGTFAAAPFQMLGWMGFAAAINFGLQVLTLRTLKAGNRDRGSLALVSGNRNMALFFAALPAAQTEAYLPFLAAYQFPMYLTPIVLAAAYRAAKVD